MALADTSTTHFAEADVRRIVLPNLRFLLELCRDVNESIRKAAHRTLECYGAGGLPFVQQLIAEDMLGRYPPSAPRP